LGSKGGQVVAVDPGLRGCGVAEFSGGLLLRARYVVNPEKKARGPGAWAMMAIQVTEVVTTPGVFVVEVMQNDGRSMGKVEDVLQVQGVAAWILALGGSVVGYQPREWKGSVPKPIHNTRVLGKLTSAERKAIVNDRHDVIDAIGLGLYYLGR
jgi:hypothetical protein